MPKSRPALTLSLLIFLFANLISPSPSFSQTETEEETITISTYYPAPFGVYNEMRAKRMAIGDNYYNGSQYCWPPAACGNQIDGTSSSCWPNCNTDLVVEGNVGIGTASPSQKLHISGVSGIDGIQFPDGTVQTTAGGGKVVQTVFFQTGEYATGSTKIPYDDTIPQNTEGDEYMSLSITPKSATNILRITVVANATASDNTPTMALFRDNQVNALAATYFVGYPQWITPMTINHFMPAGTTSAITFKVRIGSSNSDTYFNGQGPGFGRRLGGAYSSSITITEYTLN